MLCHFIFGSIHIEYHHRWKVTRPNKREKEREKKKGSLNGLKGVIEIQIRENACEYFGTIIDIISTIQNKKKKQREKQIYRSASDSIDIECVWIFFFIWGDKTDFGCCFFLVTLYCWATISAYTKHIYTTIITISHSNIVWISIDIFFCIRIEIESRVKKKKIWYFVDFFVVGGCCYASFSMFYLMYLLRLCLMWR